MSHLPLIRLCSLFTDPTSALVSQIFSWVTLQQINLAILDALLRSSLYSHFSESLSGLATIRAYGEVDRFRQDNINRVDVENRAYWLTVANQACNTYI